MDLIKLILIMKLLNNSKGLRINCSDTEQFILNEYGISSNVAKIEGKVSIKVYHHFSLFSIISKVRKNFDFTVHHKFEKNEYIIILGNRFN